MSSSLLLQQQNFMYFKNKFRLLVQKDTTVSLLVDEIHQKTFCVIILLAYLKKAMCQQLELLLSHLTLYSYNIRMLC